MRLYSDSFLWQYLHVRMNPILLNPVQASFIMAGPTGTTTTPGIPYKCLLRARSWVGFFISYLFKFLFIFWIIHLFTLFITKHFLASLPPVLCSSPPNSHCLHFHRSNHCNQFIIHQRFFLYVIKCRRCLFLKMTSPDTVHSRLNLHISILLPFFDENWHPIKFHNLVNIM